MQLAGIPINHHYFSDIEVHANKIYQQNFPQAKPLGDIRTINGKELRKLPGSWIITGGFPCQDISTAGQQAGIGGSRSGLWWEMHRIIDELRPEAILVENVPALSSAGLERVLLSLARSGYDAEWQTISGAAVGAPHLRKRIWIAAYPTGSRYDGNSEPYSDGGAVGARHKLDGKADSDSAWTKGQRQKIEAKRSFRGKPLVRRVDDGFSAWLDRVKGLGNAIVPQVAAEVLKRMDGAKLLNAGGQCQQHHMN